MRGIASLRALAAGCLAAGGLAPVLPVWPVPVAAQVTVLERAFVPPRPVAGAAAEERLVVRAPAAARLTVSDAAPPGDGVERLGRWRGVREVDGGAATWTFSVPLVAWREGWRTAPPLAVAAVEPGGEAAPALHLEGAPFQALAPDPAGYAPDAPAPPEGAPPLQGGPGYLGVALVLLATVAWVGWGVLGWWATRSHRIDSRRGDEPPAAAVEGARLEGVAWDHLDLAVLDPEPGAMAVALAEAVRVHPRVASHGVTRAQTTREALRAGAPAGVGPALRLADAVKYGAHLPTREEVVAAAELARRALDAGGNEKGVAGA